MRLKYSFQIESKNTTRYMLLTLTSAFFIFLTSCFSKDVNLVNNESKIDSISISENQNRQSNLIEKDSFVSLINKRIIQSKVMNPKAENSVYEPAINSPKSATYTKDGKKFYINSLEGYTTVVFDAKTLNKIKEIKHKFTADNNYLFKNNESSVFDYKYKQERKEFNHFLGKPVESCLSHNGKFLWVTYYRRNWDEKAESPSAVAIIDTEKDEIVRVIPTGPLPKMIVASPNNKFVAVTHWGDNTVALIDISSSNPMDFNYKAHIVVDYRLAMDFDENTNRDSECGNCLRGTIFTPDSKKLLVAKMGGNGIAIIDVDKQEMVGTITGSYLNLRHLVINKDELFLSSNKFGMVQRANLNDLFNIEIDDKKILNFKDWHSVKLGTGVRTIDVTKNNKYIFACVNNDSKIAIIDANKMEKIFEIDVASFPVGMALSPDEKQLVVTSQGKSGTPGSGNTVTVYDVIYN